VQLTQHRRNVVTTSGSGDETCCGILQRLDSPHDVLGHSIQKDPQTPEHDLLDDRRLSRLQADFLVGYMSSERDS